MFLLNNEIDNENSTIMKTRRILGYGSNQSSHANFCGKNVENCPGEGRENDGKKEEGIGNMGGVREINDRNNDKYKGEYRRSVEHMERRKEKYELPDTDRDDLIPYNNHYEDKVNKYNKILGFERNKTKMTVLVRINNTNVKLPLAPAKTEEPLFNMNFDIIICVKIYLVIFQHNKRDYR